MKEKFDFVVARHWDDEGSKAIYTWHTQVQRGDMEDAMRSPEHDDWKLYKINYEEIVRD